MSAVTGIMIVCWIFLVNLPSMVVFAVVFGFSSGGLIPLGAGCVAQIASAKDRV